MHSPYMYQWEEECLTVLSKTKGTAATTITTTAAYHEPIMEVDLAITPKKINPKAAAPRQIMESKDRIVALVSAGM